MKKNRTTIYIATFCILLSPYITKAQNVGINETGATPDASALLDLSATNKGFLITRVDTVNISSPAFGLMTLAPKDSCLYMFSGIKWIGMGGAGKNCTCNCNNPNSTPSEFPCDGTVIPIIDITNPITGKTWMDRNLGATQVATSSTDAAAYGDLYQWGRCSDGHEKRTSGTTTTQSNSDNPGHGDFITGIGNTDWRNTQNNSLWQGTSGINNPCPDGYRVPTNAELEAERNSWATNNEAGAFGSPLKWTIAGKRKYGDAALSNVGTHAFYWSSTISTSYSYSLYMSFSASGAYTGTSDARVHGYSIRCIKD